MGKLSFEQGKFYFSITETMRDDKRARNAGLSWDVDALRWVTRSADKAQMLRRFADESAEKKLKKRFITSYAPPEQIIYPDDKDPFSWQLESAWHCLTRSPAYCADEAGLGKTAMFIMCANSVQGNALITCPAFLKYNWEDEIKEWGWNGAWARDTIKVIESGDTDEKAFDVSWVILPDSLLTDPKIQSYIKKRTFTWLGVDEAHRYKTALAQRTAALVGKLDDENYSYISERAQRIILMSGTPIPQGRPIELYPVLSQLSSESIGHRSMFEYGREFCGAKRVVRYEGRKPIVNWDFQGTSNLSGLRSQLREKLMIRHLKKDHLKELGPKRRKIVFLDTPDVVHKMDEKLLKNYTLEELMGEKSKLGDIATYRKEIGEAKTLSAFSYLHQLLDDTGEKLVVFAYHINVVETLHRMLSGFGSLMIRGGMTAKAKSDAVKRFQTDPKYRVIVGNIDAMGVGHTLTKAPRVVAVEYSWSPGVNEQAEDRIHRISQNDTVYCQYLVMRGSLDERMLRSVLSKQKAIKKVMG